MKTCLPWFSVLLVVLWLGHGSMEELHQLLFLSNEKFRCTHTHRHTCVCLCLMWVTGCIFHAGSQQAELLYSRLTSPVWPAGWGWWWVDGGGVGAVGGAGGVEKASWHRLPSGNSHLACSFRGGGEWLVELCSSTVAALLPAAQSSLLATRLAPRHSLLQFAAIKRTPKIRCQLKQSVMTLFSFKMDVKVSPGRVERTRRLCHVNI